MLATSYTLSETTSLPFTEAVERVHSELQAEGFGVLSCDRRAGNAEGDARHRPRAVHDPRCQAATRRRRRARKRRERRAVMAATAPRQPAVRAQNVRHLILIRPDRRRFV
jgi:hypothetical protein